MLAYGVLRERRQAIRVVERSAELERLYSEVARANTAKSEFLANISHELRTPLNAIVGFVELLKDGVYGDLSPRQVPPVDRIAASATHLRHLVDQVLDIAKIAAGRLEVHPETLVLRPFVFNIASELESLVNERGLSFSIAVGASLPRVRTDPTHLRQILVNLIGNAVKYTPQGGVAVRARLVGSPPSGRRMRPTDVARLRILCSAAQSPDSRRAWIALQVVDTGVGIAPADQARIFEEFEQVNAGPRSESMQRGTGLGLAISKRLAQLLGGDIRVDSELGKGSTFTLWLPVHPDDLDPGACRRSAGVASADQSFLRNIDASFDASPGFSFAAGALPASQKSVANATTSAIALRRLFAQATHDDRFELRRKSQTRLRLIEHDRRLRQQLREHLARRLCRERQTARQKEVRDRRQDCIDPPADQPARPTVLPERRTSACRRRIPRASVAVPAIGPCRSRCRNRAASRGATPDRTSRCPA